MALEDEAGPRGKGGKKATERLSTLRGVVGRAAEAQERPMRPAPKPTTPPRPETAASSGRPERASLVRSMMHDIETKAPAAAPARPRISPEPKRRPRQAKATIPPAPDLAQAFENEPDDRAQRARRAAERVRQRAAPAPAAPTPKAEPKKSIPDHAPRSGAGTAPPTFAPKPVRLASTKPFAGFEWDIASRYLRARRKEGFISVIAGFSLVGIGLGVATLIIVMAVMTGFRETLVNQFIGVDAHVTVTSQVGPLTEYDSLALAIRQVDGVIRAAPAIEGQVLASNGARYSGTVVRGIRREDLAQLKVVTDPEASVGSLDAFEGDDGIAIGDGVAQTLGIRLGDSINLVSPEGDLTPFGTMPRSKAYPVVYIFKLGLTHYDNGLIYMPLKESQLYFNKKGIVDAVEVAVSDATKVEDFVQPIREGVNQSVGLRTWKDARGTFIAALDVERNVMFLILTMIILVAALNIISGLVMLVKDKARDVAIMRTMGMSRGSVLRIFFICGSSIGVIGSVIGCILGVLFCLNIEAIQGAVESVVGPVFPAAVYGLSSLPAELVASDVLKVLFMALGLSFIATLFPAWKAANLDPVDALRYE